MSEIEKENSFGIFDFLFGFFVRYRTVFIAFFILLFLGATTVIAFCLKDFGPMSDTFIGKTAHWLAEQEKIVENLLIKNNR